MQTYAMGTDADHPPLPNKDGAGGVARSTSIVVIAGDQIELKPLMLIREKRKVLEPVLSRTDNVVCVQTTNQCIASVPVFQHQCDDHCSLCIKCIPFLGCAPWRCCDTVCQDVHTGDQCVASVQRCTQNQDQWTDTSTFPGLGPTEMVNDTTPMASADLIAAGIKLRFSYFDTNGGTKQVDCPLSVFKPHVDPDRFSFTLSNEEGCQPFADPASSQATLAIVNAMSVQVAYQQGTLIRTWDGRTLAQPKSTTYSPSIAFAGVLTVTAAHAAR